MPYVMIFLMVWRQNMSYQNQNAFCWRRDNRLCFMIFLLMYFLNENYKNYKIFRLFRNDLFMYELHFNLLNFLCLGILSGPTTMRHNIGTARRTDPSRFDRERERDRDRDLNRDRRDKRENRPATKRSRSPSSRRSRSPTSRQRSPTRRRAAPRVAPRYVVNVPKITLNK